MRRICMKKGKLEGKVIGFTISGKKIGPREWFLNMHYGKGEQTL